VSIFLKIVLGVGEVYSSSVVLLGALLNLKLGMEVISIRGRIYNWHPLGVLLEKYDF
jgi:hypothetical protein